MAVLKITAISGGGLLPMTVATQQQVQVVLFQAFQGNKGERGETGPGINDLPELHLGDALLVGFNLHQ